MMLDAVVLGKFAAVAAWHRWTVCCFDSRGVVIVLACS